jgi:alpha-L-rhamnosidase
MIAKIAGILGKTEDVKKYNELADKIAKAFNEKHFDKKNSTYTGNTQTANLIPLNFGIVPKEYEKAVAASIAENVKAKDNHLTTGFLGVSLLLPTLSDYGYNDLAYKVASQKTYPSWGYTVEKGATSIWELWNGDTEGPSMNSRNHFALGSVGEWFYGYLGGIKPTSDMPGFKKIILAPMPVNGLDWAEANLETTYGVVASRWKRNGNTISYNFTIPVNTTAEFQLPFFGKEVVSIKEGDLSVYDNNVFSASQGIELLENENNKMVIGLGAGEYSFVVEYE